MEVCIELADVSREVFLRRPFVRLSVALEKKWPDMQGWQLEQILDLCNIATYHVNSFFTDRGDTFLKIAISLKNPQALFLAQFSSAELVQMITDGSEPQITIRRNVVPKQGYWTKLQEACHLSHWTREFYPNHVIEQSLSEGKSLMEKLKERRQRGEQCELARSLRTAVVQDLGKRVELRRIASGAYDATIVDPAEFSSVKRLASGNDGTVSKVVWENCTYAMKSFIMAEGAFSNELSIARLGPHLHPNILSAFGHSPDDLMAEEEPFLLMELLDGDLLRCLYEHARAPDVARLSFSRVDRLDVLLQIAMAMRNLHENWVVHGDLKLGNILVSEFEVSGNVRHFLAKVADFGRAKKIQFGSESFKPNGCTTEYASPEELRSRVDRQDILSDPKKLDVYSFGVVAYEVLTGHKAFNGKLDTEKIRQVSTGEKKLIDSTEWRNLKGGFGYFDEVIGLVERCLEFDPEERPTFSTICDELSQLNSNLQDWVKKVAAYQKSFVTLFPIIVMLFVFLHYASQVWIITVSQLRPQENTHFRWIPVFVLLIVTACLIGSWACRPKFLSIRLKAKIN